jgi:hypothetical protein
MPGFEAPAINANAEALRNIRHIRTAILFPLVVRYPAVPYQFDTSCFGLQYIFAGDWFFEAGCRRLGSSPAWREGGPQG